ncbi:MAG: hypothetical protein ACI9R3_006432 [Verrucomicrobiales bacterium]|jgi:hypothetical protein
MSVSFARLPRFHQTPDQSPKIRITERDLAILREVAIYRFLRSTHLSSLIVGSCQQILRRLQLLYHNGYLERPRAQIDTYYRGGSRPIVYGLGSKGAALLRRKGIFTFDRMSWTSANRSAGRLFLDHTLMVADVIVGIRSECQTNQHFRFIDGQDLPCASEDDDSKRFQWTTSVTGHGSVKLIPDRVFAIEQRQTGERILFLLEADRGTEPLTRTDFHQSSIDRKLLLYSQLSSERAFLERFGCRRVRALLVTTSRIRAQSIQQLMSKHRNAGLFLTSELTSLVDHKSLLDAAWINRSGEEESLNVQF